MSFKIFRVRRYLHVQSGHIHTITSWPSNIVGKQLTKFPVVALAEFKFVFTAFTHSLLIISQVVAVWFILFIIVQAQYVDRIIKLTLNIDNKVLFTILFICY